MRTLEDQNEHIETKLNQHMLDTVKNYVSNETLERNLARFDRNLRENGEQTNAQLAEVKGMLQQFSERFNRFMDNRQH